jgi:hypothetical protein
MYFKNKDHEKFASWTYEHSLLGFSYSYDLKTCFNEDPDVVATINDLSYLSELEDLSDKETFSAIAVVKNFFTKESQAGNKYMILTLADNTATKSMMFIDSRENLKFTNFMLNNKLKKTDVVFLTASRSNKTFFIDTLKVKGPEIYMYKRQVKDK